MTEQNFYENVLFIVKQTPNAGRAVFARQDIEAGTVLWSSTDLGPSVIFRRYRKITCAQCFKHNEERSWKIRHKTSGTYFCSEDCKDDWLMWTGPLAISAYEIVEEFVKINRKRRDSPRKEEEEEEGGDNEPDTVPPDVEIISEAWSYAKKRGELIIAARTQEQPSKLQVKALRNALATAPRPDSLIQCLLGLLCAATKPELWSTVKNLYTTETPYQRLLDLQEDIASYLHLLALLPQQLLPLATSKIIRTLLSASASNSFSIRLDEKSGSLTTSDDTLGWGLWPSAAAWNHSCDPNLLKRREGRVWVFSAERDIKRGEEMCITYLGGDEKKLRLNERRAILLGRWGFDCMCSRCREDE